MQPVRGDDENIDQREGRNRKSETCEALSLITRVATGGEEPQYVLERKDIN